MAVGRPTTRLGRSTCLTAGERRALAREGQLTWPRPFRSGGRTSGGLCRRGWANIRATFVGFVSRHENGPARGLGSIVGGAGES